MCEPGGGGGGGGGGEEAEATQQPSKSCQLTAFQIRSGTHKPGPQPQEVVHTATGPLPRLQRVDCELSDQLNPFYVVVHADLQLQQKGGGVRNKRICYERRTAGWCVCVCVCVCVNWGGGGGGVTTGDVGLSLCKQEGVL